MPSLSLSFSRAAFASLPLLLCTAAAAAPGDRGQLVAVLEIRNKLRGADKEQMDTAYLTDVVRTAVLDNARGAQVMTRENITVLLAAQGKKLADCEGECEVDTGRLLGADLIVTGEVLKFGTSFKMNLKLHETSAGRLLSGAQIGGATVDELDREIPGAVRKLVAPIAQGPQAQQPAPQPRPQQQPAPAQPAPAQRTPAETGQTVGGVLTGRGTTESTPPAPALAEQADSPRFNWTFDGSLGYVKYDLCGDATTACELTTAGPQIDLGLHYRLVNSQFRVGFGAGFKYAELTPGGLPDGVDGESASYYSVYGAIPLELALGPIVLGWSPYLEVPIEGEGDTEFRYNRLQAFLEDDGTRYGVVFEAPIGGPFLIAAGVGIGY